MTFRRLHLASHHYYAHRGKICVRRLHYFILVSWSRIVASFGCLHNEGKKKIRSNDKSTHLVCAYNEEFGGLL